MAKPTSKLSVNRISSRCTAFVTWRAPDGPPRHYEDPASVEAEPILEGVGW
jgi:hypothetical protein